MLARSAVVTAEAAVTTTGPGCRVPITETVVTTAVITALLIRSEWFGLDDNYNPEEVKKHD